MLAPGEGLAVRKGRLADEPAPGDVSAPGDASAAGAGRRGGLLRGGWLASAAGEGPGEQAQQDKARAEGDHPPAPVGVGLVGIRLVSIRLVSIGLVGIQLVGIGLARIVAVTISIPIHTESMQAAVGGSR
jgi:hypothetical protein